MEKPPPSPAAGRDVRGGPRGTSVGCGVSFRIMISAEDVSHERSIDPGPTDPRPRAPARRDGPGRRAEPAYRAGVRRTPGERRRRVQSAHARGGVQGVSSAVATDAGRSGAAGAGAGLAVAGLREAVGEHGAAYGRGGGRAGGGARAGRPPVHRRRLDRKPDLRPHPAELPARVEVHALHGARDGRARCPHRTEGGLLHPPVHRRPRADQFRDDEPRGGPAHRGDRRREPRAGTREHARRPRAGPGPAADQDDRPGEVQAGRERRRYPRQGRVRERPDAAHPVRTRHGGGAQAAAAHHPAVDQQVLHPGPPPEELVHQVGGGSGSHRVRDLLGEPGRAAGRKKHGRLHAGRPHRRSGCESGRRPASPASTRSGTAWAAPCWPRPSRI